jgi:hypothetical protein
MYGGSGVVLVHLVLMLMDTRMVRVVKDVTNRSDAYGISTV